MKQSWLKKTYLPSLKHKLELHLSQFDYMICMQGVFILN